MSDNKTTTVTSPFLSILALVFITLKLAGIGAVATWSWWAVLSPIWVPVALLLVVLVICVIFAVFLNK